MSATAARNMAIVRALANGSLDWLLDDDEPRPPASASGVTPSPSSGRGTAALRRKQARP